MDMRKHIASRAGLAVTYAEDGAYFSAARVLRDLTAEVEAHTRSVDDFLRNGEPFERPDDPCDPFNPHGSGPVPVEPREG